MDMRKTAGEIGLMEAAINLAKVRNSEDIIWKVGQSMPLPDDDIEERVDQIAQWLLSSGKTTYMLLTPEIALADAMARHSEAGSLEIIMAITSNMDEEARERLNNNLPRTVSVKTLDEPYFAPLIPRNGMIVVCGYCGGDRLMVMDDTYRMVEHYSSFLGKKVFIPYVELDGATRYDGWMELNPTRISATWRKA